MSLFSDAAKAEEAVEALKRRFARTPVLAGLCKVPPEDLLAALRSAEAEVSRRLRIFLEPTWVFPEDVTQEQIDARLPAGSPFIEESGYDYDPAQFGGRGTWGFIIAKHRPVIELAAYRFVYSDPKIIQFKVPDSWVRLDKKYGHIRLLPTGELATLPLNAALLQIFSGYGIIPQMIRLTYLSGIKDVRTEHPDLYSFLFRVAGLQLIMDRFPGNSASISADGLSRSTSFAIKDWMGGGDGSGVIDAEYARWRQFFHGVQNVIL